MAVYNIFTGLSSLKNAQTFWETTSSPIALHEEAQPVNTCYFIYLLRIRAALVPPKPKELDMTVWTSDLRATWGAARGSSVRV